MLITYTLHKNVTSYLLFIAWGLVARNIYNNNNNNVLKKGR